MSKFKTIHSHQANLFTIAAHLGAPLLAFLASQHHYDLPSDPPSHKSIFYSPNDNTIFITGLVANISASIYGFTGEGAKELKITHNNGLESTILIKPQSTWFDTIMKFAPLVSAVEYFAKDSAGLGLGMATASGVLALYEGFTNQHIKYDFYEGNIKLDNLTLDNSGDHILENGIPIHFTD